MNFKWFYDQNRLGPLSVKLVPESIDIPEYNPKYTNQPFFWNIKNKNTESFACIGCSITYGTGIEHDKKWPTILQTHLDIPVLNFGLSGAGADSIYINLKWAYDNYKFKKVIINLPNFKRCQARFKRGKVWWRWPVAEVVEWKDLDWEFKNYDKKKLNFITNDHSGRYSKFYIKKIIKFLEQKKLSFFLTSWCKDVYLYLEKNLRHESLLPYYDISGPTVDGFHPTNVQNIKFVESILSKITT